MRARPFAPPFDRVEVDADAAPLPFAERFLARLPGSIPVRLRQPRDPAPAGRRTVHVTREPGAFLKPCPCSPGAVRCGYRVFTPAFQCPFGCTYCFLRLYAPDAPLTLYANLEDAEAELAAAARKWEGSVRVGTGQFADSLALDPWTGHARWLLDLFERLPGVQLELKTKSARVEALLDRRPPPNAVAAWSVNPPERIASDEPGSATLAERLEAAAAAARAGYRVGFHFDPVVAEEGWEAAYRGVIGALFEAVEPSRVAWVSLGTLRFPPRFLEEWGPRLRGRRAFFGELVPGEDGKLRYFWPLRKRVYRVLAEALRREGGPELRVYLCMESPAMWGAALGWRPREDEVEGYLAAGASAGAPDPGGR
jgi:spore photoproduct lyase